MTFVVTWALARKLGWRMILRMEDLDVGRVRPGAADEAIAVLRWLGLDWDEGPFVQSDDLSPYRGALEQLRTKGLLYPCHATRKEIEQAASAPHASDQETRYPGINRPTPAPQSTPGTAPGSTPESTPGSLAAASSVGPDDVLADDGFAWRVIVPDGPVDFVDELLGAQSIDVQAQVGDFALATKAGLPAYQLAVVVDDARQGVTDVVRGEDLISSTPRQMLLYRMLGLENDPGVPRYWHLPLVRGMDGLRMAKRDDSVRLTTYLEAGVPGERVLGLFSKWAGLSEEREPMSIQTFTTRLNPHAIRYDSPRFTEEDERWLMGKD